MEKLVKRVTVVQGSGERRTAKVVYERDEDEDDEEDSYDSTLESFERTVRRMLKARLIAAEDAYQRHLDAVAKGGNSWVVDDALNMMRGGSRKARKEMQKASPFGRMKFKVEDEDEDEDEDEK